MSDNLTETTELEGVEPAPVEGGYQAPMVPPLLVSGPDAGGLVGHSGPSVPTVLWGLILAAVAAGAIVHQVSDVDFNFSVGVPIALLAVGAALVVWGVAGLARRRH